MTRLDPSVRGASRYAMLLLALLLLPCAAHAVELYPIDELLGRINGGVQDQWLTAVKDVAGRLFWSLALISLTWTMCMMVFRRADFGELFAELVRFIIMTGLFWWLLDQGSGLIQQLLESMRLLGADGSGGGGTLQPSNLLRSGYRLFFAVAKYSEEGEWKDADKIVGLTMAAVILALVALAAVSMMLITLMTWILGYAGLFLLGFGGARWTSGVAINYYKHVLAVGMSYFVMLLLAGIGDQFISDYSSGVAAQITLPNLGIMLVAAIVLLALLVRIPAMVSAMVLGSRFGGAGGGSFSGHVMALGGTAIAAGVSQASSGAQALYSAYNAPSATPPPAPMISMPTFQVPAAPAAPAAPPAAPAPMSTAMISVSHLDGSGVATPQVTLSTQGMYPPPAGAAQSSVFGATPSAQDVARAQVQAAPGAGGGAGSGAGAPAAVATAAAATVATPGSDGEAGRAAAPAGLAAAELAAAGTGAQRDPLAMSAMPSLDGERPQRNRDIEPALPGAPLAAATASLPATPAAAPHASDAEADAAQAGADADAGVDAITRKVADRPEPGFSSFASQPLSGQALPADRDEDDQGSGNRRRNDTPASSIGTGAGGGAAPLPAGKGQPLVASSSSPAAGRAPAGSASAAPMPAAPSQAGRAVSSSAAAANSTVSGSAPSSARDGRDGRAAATGTGSSGTSRSGHANVAASGDASAPPPSSSVSQVIPAADRATAAAPFAAPPPATAAQAPAAAQQRRPRWFGRLLQALRQRWQRRHGRGDHDGG